LYYRIGYKNINIELTYIAKEFYFTKSVLKTRRSMVLPGINY